MQHREYSGGEIGKEGLNLINGISANANDDLSKAMYWDPGKNLRIPYNDIKYAVVGYGKIFVTDKTPKKITLEIGYTNQVLRLNDIMKAIWKARNPLRSRDFQGLKHKVNGSYSVIWD